MKKFIALVLSLIMTFAVASPAYAISNGYAFVETSVLANCDVQEKMEDILCAVEPQKALFGLSDINFENVQLGEEIPVYETYNNSLVPSDCLLYTSRNWILKRPALGWHLAEPERRPMS